MKVLKRLDMQQSIRFDDVMAYVRLAPEEAVRRVYQACAERLTINIGEDSDGESEVKGMTSAGAAMSAALGGVTITSGSSLVSQLQKKVESNDQLESIAPPTTKMKLKVVGKSAQYSTTDCEVVDAKDKEMLQTALAACEKIKAKFPYGKGTGKNLLRIAKCSNLTIGKTVEVTIRFYPWSRDGGDKGITAYLAK